MDFPHALLVPGGEQESTTKSSPDVPAIEEGFIWDAMQKAYDPKINMVRDISIDDSHLPFAENYWDFVANIIGKDIKRPFARQLWISLILLGEICPRCTKTRAFDMYNVPLDLDPADLANALTLFKHGICHKCGATKWDCIQAKQMKLYDEAVLVLGQRAGKSTTTAMIATYVFHRMLMSPRLSRVARGIQLSTQLTATFVALTVTNAYKLLWMPTRDTIVDSTWFKEWFALMDQIGHQQGKELYQFAPTGTYFRIFTKGIDAFPAGPSMRNLRGPTRVFAATDELGHFPFNPLTEGEDNESQRERANADEVHQVLSTSLATVRGEVLHQYSRGVFTYPMALNLSVSSPLSWQDKVMRLYGECATSDSMFGVRAPTWDITPLFPRDHPVIKGAYNRNPRRAERDFGANPPKLASAVFGAQVRELFTGTNDFATIYEITAEHTKARYVAQREPAKLPPAVLSIDAGLTNNSFTLTLMHRLTERDGIPEKVGHIKVTGIMEVIPSHGTIVDYDYLYENAIKPIILSWNVRELFADRWNSVFILRKAEVDSGGKLKAYQHTTTRRDCDAFIQLVNAKQIWFPTNEIEFDKAETVIDYKEELKPYPVAHLYRQFRTVQEFQGILTKGSGSTDDIFRSVLVGATRFGDPKVLERFDKYPYIDREAKSAKATILVSGRTLLPGRFRGFQGPIASKR
jgi:hypothetical protein